MAVAWSVVAVILAAVAASDAVPWLTLTTYNATAGTPSAFSFTDAYSTNGATSTQACPYPGGRGARCVSNPPDHAPLPLAAFAPSLDTARAYAAVHATTAVALVLAVVVVAVLACGLVTTTFYPATRHAAGAADPSAVKHAPRLLAAAAACAFTAVAMQAAALGTYRAAVFDVLAANTTAITTAPGNGAPPSIAMAVLQPGDGYNVAAADIAFLLVPLLAVGLAALLAPRWCRGTRAGYYADAVAAAAAAGALPPPGAPPVPYAPEVALLGTYAFASGQPQPQPLPQPVPYATVIAGPPVEPQQWGARYAPQTFSQGPPYAPQQVYHAPPQPQQQQQPGR